MPRILSVLLSTLLLGSVAVAATWPAHPATTPDISAADILARDKAISDDVFEGRAPGTVPGEAAAQWVADELKRIGIKPGNPKGGSGGSYFQTVPAVTIQLDSAASKFSFATPKGMMAPKFADDAVFWTPQYATPDVNVANSDMVFVGYGVVAPEYGWNDYAGIDVRGKTVVILINDPGNEDATPDDKFFKGRAMTYYGRWTYKYEEAARQGAAAAIIVHETKPAAYGWQVVRNSNGSAKMWLEAANQNKSMLPIEGWMQLDLAKDLFARAGLDYTAQKAAANKRGFKAVAMTGNRFTIAAHSSILHMKTRNVVGLISGSRKPGEVFVYSAHWDHLGRKDNLAGPDKIYNGAVDNGMGVSEVLELAEKFAHEKRPQRSIAFAFWTLEEQGLLGAEYFGAHPLWPRKNIVGVINLDGDNEAPPARNLEASGTGQSELEDVLSDALATQHRVLSPDPQPEKGSFFRSDHFSLAKVGIPAISPGAGRDLVKGGEAAGMKLSDEYTEKRYHQPSDEWSASWDLSGRAQDLRAYYIAGDTLANSDRWPNYYKTSEFRALRDKDRPAGATR